jgi:hypothetical protein
MVACDGATGLGLISLINMTHIEQGQITQSGITVKEMTALLTSGLSVRFFITINMKKVD